MLILTGAFLVGRTQLQPVRQWNRAFADAATIMLCLTLAIGPAARFSRLFTALLPLRRELGIWMAVAAILHVLVYASEVYHWNILLFWFIVRDNRIAILRDGFGALNWVGLAALVYTLALAVTANDAAQRALGQGWKLLQQQNYTLFILTILHGGLFVYLVSDADHSIVRPAFAAVALFTVGLQTGGYLRAVRHWRQRYAAAHPPDAGRIAS